MFIVKVLDLIDVCIVSHAQFFLRWAVFEEIYDILFEIHVRWGL
jgi:hypothetical protein